MSIDNIVIPGGILSTWSSPPVPEDDTQDSAPETFDITEVARQRARTLSVSFVGPALTSRDGPGRLGDILVTNQRTQGSAQRRSNSTPGQETTAQGRQRATTINLGGLGGSSVTGYTTPTNRGLHRSSSLTLGRRRPSEGALPLAAIPGLKDTFVFQSLGNSQSSAPSTFQVARHPSTFRGRNASASTVFSRGRKTSSPGKFHRSQSDTSRYSDTNVLRRASIVVDNAVERVKDTVTNVLRRSSLEEVYEKAKIRQLQLQRSNAAQFGFEYTFYLFLIAIVYFVFVGVPFWDGLVLTIYHIFDMKLVVPAGTAIFLGIGFLYAYLPLLVLFEKEPAERPPPDSLGPGERGQASDTALMIPCYKSEKLIAQTLEAALKVFPAQNIFVVANGNSPTPLDNTAAVCERYGVSHTWSPIGSKIVAQYVGCYVTKRFPYVLLIDDDCILPPNFPIVTERMSSTVQCIGYTIKSVGPNSSKGTLCQQAQDVEYKISGIQRAFSGKVGSATFPHGAISIWDRELLIKTFQAHPGFSVSEDWFFGHVARQLGCRIQMCTAVFVETETPDAIFFSGGGDRGGFGEMTIYKQRFFRWNFFFVSGIYYDMLYILFNWKLGWWEIGAKIFVFQEVYETLLYLLAPFVLPISFYVRPSFSAYLYAATLLLYMVNVVIFNYVHLRLRNESVSALCLLYYLPYKIILTFVNIASCYYSIYKYAKYFAKRHPKIIEDEKAVTVVLRLEEESFSAKEKAEILAGRSSVDSAASRPRRFTVTAVGTDLESVAQGPLQEAASENIDVIDFGAQATSHLESVPEDRLPSEPPSRSLSRIGRVPPAVPPPRRTFSWHRAASRTSTDSNVSPLDEGKKLHLPLPSPETVLAQDSSNEQYAPERRLSSSPVFFRRALSTRKYPFPRLSPETSLEDKASNEELAPGNRQPSPVLFRRSLNSKKYPFPIPPSETNPADPAPNEELALQNRQPSPVFFRRSLTSSILCGSSSGNTPLTRQPTGAPPLRSMLRRPPSALLPVGSSHGSERTYNLPSPSANSVPQTASSDESGGFIVVSSARDIGGGWPLRSAQQSDSQRYISALADTGNAERWNEGSKRKGRVIIAEEESEDEEVEREYTMQERIDVERRGPEHARSASGRMYIREDRL
ncbi:MAG: hypothetical protein Q9207_006892 [Kuettlingeria erythrocarpa]